MRNIVLVGFMGTGKTVLARRLSEKLGMEYVSTDSLIEEKERRSISDIFSKEGEDYFRAVEKDVVKEASRMNNAVIDAGGGVVLDSENTEVLKKKGIVVCLWSEPEVILERTKEYTHRPLLNVDNPLDKIRELVAFRKPFYERADYHIDTSKLQVEEVVNKIKGIINNAPPDHEAA